MPLLAFALILLQTHAASPSPSVRAQIETRIAQTPARAVGLYYRDLTTGDSLTVGAATRFHAASTMKLPVMIQLFRDRDAGLLSLEDGKAYRAGLNNTTTARDLGVLLAAIANGKAASAASCREMLGILGRQQFNEGIPAGLPAGTRVYHKTGWIGQVVYHDAALIEPAGLGRYVLVVLTGGIQKDADSYALVRDLSRLGFDAPRWLLK